MCGYKRTKNVIEVVMKRYSNDELAVLDESELYRHFHKIRTMLPKNYSSKNSNKRLETYYCYVSREVKLRQQRRNYAKKLEERKRNGK